MAAIAERGDGPPDQIVILADILNIKPGDPVPPEAARHLASILRDWSAAMLERAEGETPTSRELAVTAWQMGPLVFCFVAAEVFAETAVHVRDALPDRDIHIVGYASPLVGYLPTDEAIDEGGYESASAYRFYAHPAPFAKGTEGAVVEAVQNLVRRL